MRIAGRSARMVLKLKQSPELVKKLAASAAIGGATIVLTLEGIVKLVLSLVALM